ncbi:low affinity immunoglobulin gamma Fc region receptor III-A-like, partial [Centroberyx gerrardi]
CFSLSDPRIVLDRLQFFEYESVSFKCEGSDGSTGWRVMMRKTKGIITTCLNNCEASKGSYTIKTAFPVDSGEYWCEAGKGKRSNAVNIAVTAGSVILESPVLPVMKGDAVTLNCTTKTPSNLTADFYKDGFLIRTGSAGEMTIHSVSKSDEGLYKCNISGAGESPESWLAVRALQETPPSPRHSPWTVVTVILLALLLVVGLLHYVKHKVVICVSSETPTAGSDSGVEDRTGEEHQRISGGVSAANSPMATYAVVTKHKKKRGH